MVIRNVCKIIDTMTYFSVSKSYNHSWTSIESRHDKPNKVAYAPSEDSDQTGHLTMHALNYKLPYPVHKDTRTD